MSELIDEPFSDDDSYINVGQNKLRYNTEETSIIDESDSGTNTHDSTDEESCLVNDLSSNEISNSHRDSPIMLKRVKKSARVLDSDSDSDILESDSNLEKTDKTTSLRNTSEASVSGSANRSESFLRLQKTALAFQSDSEEEVVETQIPKQSCLIIDTNSESDGSSTSSIASAEICKEKNAAETPQALELEESENLFNLSTKVNSTRISQQFRYKSEGILNSTAVHPGNHDNMWRLSNNFAGAREVNGISSDIEEILSDHDSDVIEVSSDEVTSSPQKIPFKLTKIKNATRQQTLYPFIVKKEAPTPQQKQPKPLTEIQPATQQNARSPKVAVSRMEYETQLRRVNSLEVDYVKLQNMIENINYDALPDKGQLIKERLIIAENRYRQEKNKLDQMNISGTKVEEANKGAFANVAWEDIEAGTNAVLPKTFGKTAMSTYNAQKAVTLDRLQQLHEALRTCPKEEDYEDDPKGIKVPLMPHQKRALAWIMFREKEKPSGGILADDMGLGKTLTMLSLIVKSLELEKSGEELNDENEYIGKNTKYNGGSLIVCPASLLNQWSGEIDHRLKRGLVSYILYHGPKRETRAKKLAEYDVVITTYAIVNNEADRQSAALKIKWRRVILDEAHIIRNYKAQTSEACCQLLAKSRWVLTGTPMHNKELDMYALLKFLRCSPFDDLQVWKRWVGDKSSGGLERLHTVISSLMLRRTKVELMEKGTLNCMPEKKWELVKVELDKNEMKVYHKVLIFSQTLFAQFLHQRAEKNQDYADQKFTEVSNQAPNQEYHKMRQKLLKLNKVKDVSQHEILVLLLRLRQICCHPSLITAMLDENDIGEEEDQESEHLNLLDQLEKLNIEEDDEFQPGSSLSHVAQGISQDDKVSLKEASKGQLRSSDPVFAKERASSKINVMLEVLEERVLSKKEKAIIVSQWSSYLKLVATHLKDREIEFDQLDGQVPVNKRMGMVDRLNNPKDKMRILLLSLTAGGVGLNLVGANHLFLLDLHWNPQLENQAQDRIYRVGQTKPVFVYKFMAADTIEERIKALQDKKLAMAEGLLTGTKQATQSKLSLEDLRMIFGM